MQFTLQPQYENGTPDNAVYIYCVSVVKNELDDRLKSYE